MAIAHVANLAELAADALRHLATEIDRAGSDPGPTTRRMLQLDRDTAVGELVRLRDAMTDPAKRAAANWQVRMLERVLPVLAGPDTLRRWANEWDAWAMRVAA